MSLLQVQNLSISIGDMTILHDVSFTLEPGRCIGLCGASGSGKSMLGLALMGLLPDSAQLQGSLKLGDTELSTLPEKQRRAFRGKRIAMIFQEPMTALNPLQSIGRQIAEAIEMSEAPHTAYVSATSEAVRTLMRQVDLDPDQLSPNALPFQLSGGQRQRVVIAIALAQSPDVIIADEPTTALDMITQDRIMRLLIAQARGRKMSLVVITHDQALLAHHFERTLMMQDGILVDHRAAALDNMPAISVSDRTNNDEKMTSALGVQDLHLSYPKPRKGFWQKKARTRVIKGISFDIAAGEILGIAGRSGCGKTSLLQGLVGLIKPDSGTITFAQRRADSEQSRIQMVFQDPNASLNPVHQLNKILLEPLHDRKGLTDAERQSLAVEAISAVGLSREMLNRYPAMLSGGQRQRVAIARALIADPELILFDEAVSALDVDNQDAILGLIKSLLNQRQIAGAFVSHDLRFLARLCDRIIVMEDGTIVETISVNQGLESARHRATKALIAATPGILGHDKEISHDI